jgi:hypothetical protein
MVSDDSKTADTIALTGFYGFFDYAAAHWDHHSLQYARQASLRPTALLTQEEEERSLSTAWMDFVKRFSDIHEPLSEMSSEDGVCLDDSVQQFINPATVDAKDEVCNIEEIFSDWTLTRKSTEFQSLAKSIHQIMQRANLGPLGDRDKTVYLSLNGPFRPKCSRRACVHFNTGFESEEELLLHTSWHEMAYKCTHTGCYAWGTGFRTNALLQGHLKRAHPAVESEERLFPVKSRRRPRTLIEACRKGDLEGAQLASLSSHPQSTEADKALFTAAREGHLAICVHLTQRGCNPYRNQTYRESSTGNHVISVIQMSIRLGDYDLFTALRSTAREQQEIAFIDNPLDLVECILDALESPVPQFLVDLLAWNGRRADPFTLSGILWDASFVSLRQEYGGRTLSYIIRRVLIEYPSVQNGLQTLISSELERYRKSGQSPEDCYEQVLVAPDADGESLLHRLCGSGPRCTASMAVKFLVTELKPEDIRRHDMEGNPPLFTALNNRSRYEGSPLDDQENIIRSFFQKDLDDAKNTRNASGHDPLEFAFIHCTIRIFRLVFELCGADYNVLQSYRVWGVPSLYQFQEILAAVGLDRIDERSRMITELSIKQVIGFKGLLEDLEIEAEVLTVLESLIHHRPTSATYVRPEPMDASDILKAILQPDDSNAIKFLLSLEGAGSFFEKHRSKLGGLGPEELRKLFFVCLEPEAAWYDIAKSLLTEHDLDLKHVRPEENWPSVHELAARRDMDPELISMWKPYWEFWELNSPKAMQDQALRYLKDSICVSEEAGAQPPEGLGDYIQALI